MNLKGLEALEHSLARDSEQAKHILICLADNIQFTLDIKTNWLVVIKDAPIPGMVKLNSKI